MLKRLVYSGTFFVKRRQLFLESLSKESPVKIWFVIRRKEKKKFEYYN